MHIKSLALVAAAVLTAGAAQAADLNKPAKAAVDYVKVCDAYGAGFFYIPGSDTCLQISGYARETWQTGSSKSSTTIGAANYLNGIGGSSAGTTSSRNRNAFISQTEIEVDIDARTNTQFGLLRSYESIDVDYNTPKVGSAPGATITLNRGFVQWGGFTAGRIESNFTFFQGYNEELAFSELASDYQTNAVSYQASFGNGVTALIGLEDSTTSTRTGSTSFGYQGNKVPDVVGYLNVTQAWGAAQLSLAAHNVYGASTAGSVFGANNATVNKWGYAAQAGVWFNLPTLGAGDKIGFQAAYAQGAIAYTSAGEIVAGLTGTDIGTDASVGTGGSTKLNTAWNVYSSVVHNFSSTVNLAIGGGVQGFSGYDGTTAGMGKIGYTEGEIGATLAWTPVKGLLFDASVEYANVAYTGNTKTVYTALGLQNADAWIFGLRAKRSF